jgi:glycosyltransferase involved in cell wall biosynthesis
VAADAAQLVPPGDVPALAGALSSLLRDPATRSRLAAAGASRALAYSIDATAESYISLYASAVARRP